MSIPRIQIPRDQITGFCHRHHIRKLSLFGSVLRDDFNAESDVDVLIEFIPEERVGYLKLARIERQLSELLGRTVDLRTPAELSKYFRDGVLAGAEVVYERR